MRAKNIYDYDYTLGIGLSTSKILGDNLSALPMRLVVFDDEDTRVGGSFNGAMPGIDVRMNYQLDDNGDWRMPIGLDYVFYSARERQPLTPFYTQYYNHEVNVFSPYIGLNYTLLRLPLAKSLVYGGIEFRGSYVHNAEFTFSEEYVNDPTQNSNFTNSKDDAFRMGGLVRLGIEGELYERYILNASWGMGVMNLLGRDDSRGQLLTPLNNIGAVTGENTEELITNFYFSLSIHYRF